MSFMRARASHVLSRIVTNRCVYFIVFFRLCEDLGVLSKTLSHLTATTTVPDNVGVPVGLDNTVITSYLSLSG